MKTLDEVLAAANNADLRIRVNSDRLTRVARRRDEGLYHIPLVSICALIIARNKTGSLQTADIALWVGATLARHFAKSNEIYRRNEWSFEYRRRCADAIIFLENVGLVQVIEPNREISCTDAGKVFLRDVGRQTNDIGVLARELTRAFTAAEQQGLTLL
jgi:hypothetical protein